MLKLNSPLEIDNIEIIDGDTISFKYDGTEYHTRAKWIDCPEIRKEGQYSEDPLIVKHWEYGEKAKEYLGEIIEGKKIVIVAEKIDNYGRYLANWYIDSPGIDCNIQLMLVKAGMAAYSAEINRYKFTNLEMMIYLRIITEAIKSYQANRGIWSVEHFILPYDLRKMFS